jgi:pyruvate, water dikinase
MALIAWFKDIKKEDVDVVGGKGANLGEMYNIPLPVPPGFVVTAESFGKFLNTGIASKIFPALMELKAEETEKIENVSKQVREYILGSQMPKEVIEEIKEAYENLDVDPDVANALKGSALNIITSGRGTAVVAVRSSATAEDLPEASFAGQQDTYLNIKGPDNVVDAVKRCWASLYTARAIYYRIKNNFPHDKVLIAVVVQKMIHSEVSGVMFSINPSTNDESEIVIEGAYGLGDAVVGGEVSPDNYIVDKASKTIKSKKIAKQSWMYDREAAGGKTKRQLSEERGGRQKLSDEGILKLSELAIAIETHYEKPMDMEWAVEANKIYIVQARPVTTINKAPVENVETFEHKEPEGEAILEGLGASPGMASGKVKLVKEASDISKVEKGDVLVAIMTSPDYVPAMERASAIVTDEGGMTSHAAIVSRELGIPAVVGTEKATQILNEGDAISVNGSTGKVFRGIVETVVEEKEEVLEKESSEEIGASDIITGTKIYMNLSEPAQIEKYKHLPFEGIGLMRVEFIITDYIKMHPLALIARGESNVYVVKLAEGITKVASQIDNRPLTVRFSDFKTNEYANLEGGKEYEPHESNPMIGWRGVSRYVSSDYEEAFRLECAAMKKVRENYKNVHVMLPFVRNVTEVRKALEIMKEEGLENTSDFHVYLMAEVPSFAILAEEFAELPITGCSIGSNDLTQLVLGVDRDSAKLAKMGYFDERNNAVKKAISMIIKGFHKAGKTVSICGQAPSVYTEFAEFLVKEGIDAISLNPDTVIKTRLLIASTERKILLGKVRM